MVECWHFCKECKKDWCHGTKRLDAPLDDYEKLCPQCAAKIEDVVIPMSFLALA